MSREIQERADAIMRELREALVPIRQEMRRLGQYQRRDNGGPGME